MRLPGQGVHCGAATRGGACAFRQLHHHFPPLRVWEGAGQPGGPTVPAPETREVGPSLGLTEQCQLWVLCPDLGRQSCLGASGCHPQLRAGLQETGGVLGAGPAQGSHCRGDPPHP